MNINTHFSDSLTDDQKIALKKIERFLASTLDCFLLKGFAGTGKTYLMEGLVKHFKATGRNFALMAPTGRATMVIGAKTETDAFTIHKSIYNFNELVDDNQSFKYQFNLKQNEDSIDTVYIVDESSMLSDDFNEEEFFIFGSGKLLNDLITFVDHKNRSGAKIIFIGDNAQLPPVTRSNKLSFSPALNKEYLFENYQITTDEFEMKQIQRQQENSGILTLAHLLRKGLEAKEFNRFEIPHSNDVASIESSDFDKNYFETIDNKISENTIVITHSNKQALEYNKAIRQRFFPNQSEIQSGDILINTKNNYNHIVDLYNGQFLRVLEVSPVPEVPKIIRFYRKGGEKAEVTFIFRDILVELTDIKRVRHQIKCKIIDNFLKIDQPQFSSTEQQALYVDFKERHSNLKVNSKEFKEVLREDKYFNALQVKYGYAITCHKSQGGEWANVFVTFQINMGLKTTGFYRWAYTAITRAQKKIFAINVKTYSPFSEFLVQPISLIYKMPANTNYIPSNIYEKEITQKFSSPMLKAKFVEIEEKLKGQEIAFSVQSNSWVERYTFTREAQSAVIDLNYSSKGFTGKHKIISTSNAEFAEMVRQKITEPMIFKFEYNPPKAFQKELYDLISGIAQETEVPITNIINLNYCDRYFLFTEAQGVYLDCFYNGQGTYTVIKPFSMLGPEDEKLQLVISRLSL